MAKRVKKPVSVDIAAAIDLALRKLLLIRACLEVPQDALIGLEELKDELVEAATDAHTALLPLLALHGTFPETATTHSIRLTAGPVSMNAEW